MKVVLVNRSDATGGAAVVTLRLLEALRAAGIDAQMLVCEKLSDSPYVHVAARPARIRQAFLAERLKIYLANGRNRADLFKVDTASDGLPLWRHPLVRGADAVMLNWVNQGMLALGGLERILDMGKRVVWTMHDMWCLTGICHHAGDCGRYKAECGDCPFMGKRSGAHDLSHRVWTRKRRIYTSPGADLQFVAVSRWLAAKARESSLLGDARLTVIPNAFPQPDPVPHIERGDGKFRVLMGAARLDDPVKGLPELLRTFGALRRRHPGLAARTELVTFGNLRDPRALDGVAVGHRHLGPVAPTHIAPLYREADAVISTSLYETLPGTLVEGQFYGAIPVAFDRGGQPDIITHRDTGWLTDWHEDPADRAAVMADGLAWAAAQAEKKGAEIRTRMLGSATDRFSADSVAARYLEILE